MKTKYTLITLLFIVKIVFAEINDFSVFDVNTNFKSGFVENKGQYMDMNGNPVPFVLFKAQSPSMDLYITNQGITYLLINKKQEELSKLIKETKKQGREEDEVLDWSRIDLRLIGANINKHNIIKLNPLDIYYNYYGNNNGFFNIKEYEKIIIKDVYPGIDWVLYNKTNEGFKYDFIVHPGADPSLIQLEYNSQNPAKLLNDGSVNIKTVAGRLNEEAPKTFFNDKITPSNFLIESIKKNNHGGYYTKVIFNLPEFSKISKEFYNDLIIDPQLSWASIFGGALTDGSKSIATDNFGNIFIAGYTNSLDFPVQNAGSFYQGTLGGINDAYVMKFNSSGSIVWVTYYGTVQNEFASSLCVDNNGNVFVAGVTNSPSGLYMPNAFQNTYGGGANDGFVLKFDNSGNMLWGTYLGGLGDDAIHCIRNDNAGNVYVVGKTSSGDFPLNSPFQSALAGADDAFITEFSNSGNLIWSTYYGGNSMDLARSLSIDNNGSIFITGRTGSSANFPLQNAFQGVYGGGPNDIFICKFNSTHILQWSTFYGGSSSDDGWGVEADQSGDIYVTGFTMSNNFPLQNNGGFFQAVYGGGMRDAFILKFSSSGSRLWSTFYGGSMNEYFWGFEESDRMLAIDACGNVYVSFSTDSPNLPVQAPCDGGYFDNSFNGASDNAIIMFDNNCNRIWASYIGGSGLDFREAMAFDNNGNLYITGEWVNGLSNTYPFQSLSGAYNNSVFKGSDEVFILKITPSTPNYSTAFTNPSPCVCTGSANVTFTCGIPSFLPPYSYYWSNGVSLTNTSSNTHSIGGLCPGVYQVTVTAACNKSYTATYTLVPSPGNIIINATAIPVNCSLTGSVVLSSNFGTGNYTITQGTSTLASSVAFPYTLGGMSIGVNTLNILTGTCSETISFNVPLNNNLTTTITSTNVSCHGFDDGIANANVQGGTGNYSYTWSNGYSGGHFIQNLQPGTYSLTVTDGPCTSTAVISVNEPDALSLSLSASSFSLCTGDSVTFNGIASGGTGFYNYNWVNGPITSVCKTTQFTSGNFTYTLSVRDQNQCSKTETISVSFLSVKPPTINVSQGSLCVPACLTFTANHENTNALFNWNFGNGTLNNASSVINRCYLEPGTYTVSSESNLYECKAKSFFTVEIYPMPIADFNYSPLRPIESQDEVMFTDLSYNANIVKWDWYFMNLPKPHSNKQNPSYVYQDKGLYTIALVVTSKQGCKDTVLKTILVGEDYGIFVPNSFTPNGDNLNDTFQPKGFGIKEYKMMVFNRWGEQVFASNDFNFGWDGTYKGNQVKDDIYVWKIELTNVFGKSHEFTGHVVLYK